MLTGYGRLAIGEQLQLPYVRIWVTLLQRSVRSHDHLELRVDIIPYARRLYSLPAKTQLNISLLALSLTALTRMSGSGLNRFSDTNAYSPYSSQPVDFDVSKHAQRPSVRLMHPPYEDAFQLISLHNLTHASKTHTSMSEAPPLCIIALLRSPSDGERACCLAGLSTLKLRKN